MISWESVEERMAEARVYWVATVRHAGVGASGRRTLHPLDPVYPFFLGQARDCPVYPGDDRAEIVQLRGGRNQDEARVALLRRTLLEDSQEVFGIVGYEHAPFFGSHLKQRRVRDAL
jgi:hypothetical protein